MEPSPASAATPPAEPTHGRSDLPAGRQPDASAAATPAAPDAGVSARSEAAPSAGPDAFGSAGPDAVASAGRGADLSAVETVEGDGDAPRLARGQQRAPRDMVLSLLVLIVPIALLLVFYRVVLEGDAPVTIDPAPTIQEAQQAKAFPVAVPQGLGDDWHPSSATFTRQDTGATLRIGYVDPDKDPIQLVESSVPPVTLLPAELTEAAKPLDTFRAANGMWRVYQGRPGEIGLVLAEPARTIIVVGKTDVADLEELASSLR